MGWQLLKVAEEISTVWILTEDKNKSIALLKKWSLILIDSKNKSFELFVNLDERLSVDWS